LLLINLLAKLDFVFIGNVVQLNTWTPRISRSGIACEGWGEPTDTPSATESASNGLNQRQGNDGNIEKDTYIDQRQESSNQKTI